MTQKKTEVAKKPKSLPDLLGAINAYYDCSTGLDINDFSALALKGVKSRNYRKIKNPQKIKDLRLSKAA